MSQTNPTHGLFPSVIRRNNSSFLMLHEWGGRVGWMSRVKKSGEQVGWTSCVDEWGGRVGEVTNLDSLPFPGPFTQYCGEITQIQTE